MDCCVVGDQQYFYDSGLVWPSETSIDRDICKLAVICGDSVLMGDCVAGILLPGACKPDGF